MNINIIEKIIPKIKVKADAPCSKPYINLWSHDVNNKDEANKQMIFLKQNEALFILLLK
jgi:hypothetical protein